MPEAKRILKNITFQHEGAHVALVHEMQGGPANEYNTVLTKANDEVIVTLSFTDFLEKFFGMWGSQADLLSVALGFDIDQDDWEEGWSYKDWIESQADRISIMKSLHSGEKSPEALEDTEFKFLLKAKSVFEQLITSEDLSEDNSNEDDLEKSSDNPTKEESTKMDEKLEELQQQLEIEKAKAAEKEVVEEELRKAHEELETMRKARAEEAKKDMLEVVKGYSFVDESQREGLVAALIKSESQEVLLDVLEKAGKAIKAAASEELGTTEAEETDGLEKSRKNVKDIIKSRKTQK